jgi:hypothetical protein
VHRNDVWVRVESGEIGVLVGDEVRTARAGQWALKPLDRFADACRRHGIEFRLDSPWIPRLKGRYGLR